MTEQQNNNNQDNINFVLVDAYNLIYRAYHASKFLTFISSSGQNTNTVFKVIQMLEKIKKENEFKFGAIIFEGKTNKRFEIDPNYKSHRNEMPEELKIQMPYIKTAMRLLGWPVIEPEEGEADDVIATLATRASKYGLKVFAISKDKDLRAIIDDNIVIVDTQNEIIYNNEKVKEVMGIDVSQITDFLTLTGDGVDGVNGVDLIGNVTAVKLLNKYTNLQGIIDNANEITGQMGKNLRQAIEDGSLLKCKQLIELDLNIKINLKNKDIVMRPTHLNELNDFKKLTVIFNKPKTAIKNTFN